MVGIGGRLSIGCQDMVNQIMYGGSW